MPKVDQQQVQQMIIDIVSRFASDVPEPPGSLYIRPTHIGTEPAIGKAAAATVSSLLYILLSPVGDYFSGKSKALRILLDEQGMRCAPHMGVVKSGGTTQVRYRILKKRNKVYKPIRCYFVLMAMCRKRVLQTLFLMLRSSTLPNLMQALPINDLIQLVRNPWL
jgi:hypothetical protein